MSTKPASQAQNQGKKVIVGMSGGVDSSVAALLLKQQGYEVEGLFMKNWDDDDGTEYCTAATDLMDAAAVCQKLDIHLHTISFAREYRDNVFEHFLKEYSCGRTPNPDILCNREIKFKVFLEYAESLGAEHIATGHYCQTSEENKHTRLLKGLDPNKDQSYFLHAVGEAALQPTLFPIGHMEKSRVREIAQENNLVTHNKKDSTGICFIGERRFKEFLENYLPAQPGEIIDDQGRSLGRHKGLMYHTIGQRQGLGIGGIQGASEAPWYVAQKDLSSNTLVVVQGSNHPLLCSSTLIASQCHWINGEETWTSLQDLDREKGRIQLMAKTRYRQGDQVCELYPMGDNKIKVEFSQAQRAITPGQSVVFYRGTCCLGGAVIDQALSA